MVPNLVSLFHADNFETYQIAYKTISLGDDGFPHSFNALDLGFSTTGYIKCCFNVAQQ